MDKAKAPGISFQKIELWACSVEIKDSTIELRYGLGISDFKKEFSEDQTQLTIVVSFDLMQGVERPPCDFKCTFAAVYVRPPDANMAWGDFKDSVAVAHMLPFVREFICNVTMRMPIAALMIPPINAHQMFDSYRSKLARADSTPALAD